jgi:alkylation response protein AidB-like acyl-CoA dehydrogenase
MLNSSPAMDFSLSDHHLLIRDTVREFMQTEVRPHVKDWERTDHFPLDAIHKLGALGCCGMLLPEEWGGPGLDTLSYVLMLEEVARVHAAMATAISVTNSAVQTPMLVYATHEQKCRYLRRLANGEILGAFCLTEPAAGSDAAGIQSTAVVGDVSAACSGGSADGCRQAQGESASPAASSSGASPSVLQGGPSPDSSPRRSSLATLPEASAKVARQYILNGTKTWVTNGSHAGLYIVFAKTQPGLGGKGITAFLLEPNTPGLKIGRHEDKMGQRSSPSVELLLDNCVVPASARLGEEGQGLKIALSALDNGRIGIAGLAVGLAQGALDESVKYARARRAFGKSIGEFQAIQWMLADMHTELEAARALVYHAAYLKDQVNSRGGTGGQSSGSEISPVQKLETPAAEAWGSSRQMGSASSRAKLYATEMANRVVYKAVQIHGSLGYSRESEVERMYRDARVLTIYEGTSEIQRTIIARDLLRV